MPAMRPRLRALVVGAGAALYPDGSALVTVRAWQAGVLVDATFQFIAVASLPMP